MPDRKGSLLKSAFVLSLAGVVCKLLGAAYRIPLARLIGDEGIGLYQMAYPIYLLVLSLSTAGMPMAISRLTAEMTAIGDYAGARRVLRLAVWLLGAFGLLGGLVMACGARFFAENIVFDPRAYPVIISLAPAVPLMSLLAAFRGYFQGHQDVWPSALSQLVEQVVRVVTLLVLAMLLLPLGVGWASAGAAFGASAGGAAGLVLLVWMNVKYYQFPSTSHASPVARYLYLGKRLAQLALPIAIGSLFIPLMQAVDSILVPTRLQAIGYTVGQATSALGRLGNAWAVVYVPATFTTALAISLVPAVTETWTRRQYTAAKGRIEQALRTTVILCIPASVGLAALSGDICRVLYGSATAAEPLRYLAPAAFFMGLQGVSAGALQGLGRASIPLRHAVVGFFAKVALTGLLCSNPVLGARGAGLATVAGALLVTLFNLGVLFRELPLAPQMGRDLARSGAASAAMAAALFWMGRFTPMVSWTAYMRLAIMLPAGAGIFGAILWLLGGLNIGDVEIIRGLAVEPGGNKT